MRAERVRLLAWLVPPLLIGAIYAKTYDFGFVWDDLIYGNLPVYRHCDPSKILLSPANGFEYLPVRDLTYCFDRAVYGDWAGGPHLENVLLFLLAATLAQALYRFLFAAARESRVADRAPLLAFLVVLIWVAHPLQVEPVAFVAMRNALLALVFLLASLLCYARFLGSGRRLGYVASLALLPLAILSKVTAICLPLLMLMLHLYAKRDDRARRILTSLAPHFAVTALFALLHLGIASRSGTMVESMSPSDTLSRLPRALFIPSFYLYKFVWPFDQSIEYVLEGVREHLVGLGALTLFGAAAAGAIVWRGRRTRSLASFLCVAYFAALLPVLNLFPTHPPVADRYAQIALLFLAPLLFVPLLSRARGRFAGAIAAPLVAALALLSFWQLDVWRSEESLFAHAAEVDPRARLSLENLGHLLWTAGREDEAIVVFERRARVAPGEARHLLIAGLRALRRGDVETAERLMEAVRHTRGVNPVVYLGLGEFYAETGDLAQAVLYYEKARDAARRTAHRDSRAQAALQIAERELYWLERRRRSPR